ncbi:MAG: ATPase domain-containing protein [Actinomycetota bacterium]
MAKTRTILACSACRHQVSQWVGRCPGCAAWGTIEEAAGVRGTPGQAAQRLSLVGADGPNDEGRVSTGFPGIDRVLGGGLVPASVVLLAGEPGIGKSTLLLHLLGHLSASGRPTLLVSGEESHAQVAARARRLGIDDGAIGFAPGRDLEQVLALARDANPFLLAVDSIQTIRDTSGTQMPGGVSQVRTCTDALLGIAKANGIAMLLTGHVTKEGDLAGPRALEHAVDVVLTFDGDPRSGLRVLSGGKNRFGAEGESAWFEMDGQGLKEIDPTALLVGERVAGAATALPQAGRRALAVEVQALVGSADGPARRQTTGLDPRRFQLVAAVLERAAGIAFGRAELYGASTGGIRIDDPACDLAVAAALASAVTGTPPPPGAAFMGEVALTGLVRPAPAVAPRLAAARAAGCSVVYAPEGTTGAPPGLEIRSIRDVKGALNWAFPTARSVVRNRSA